MGLGRFSVILCLTAACPAALQASTRPTADTAGTEQVECEPATFSSLPCRFVLAETTLEVSRAGQLRRYSLGKSAASVQLPLEKGFTVDAILYGMYSKDLVLVYEVSDGEVGFGYVARLRLKNLMLKWWTSLPAFNLSLGAIEDRYLYQAGFGFVAKLDLNTGRFAWKHDGLYDRAHSSFNSFRRPEVGRGEVVFREEPTYAANGPPRSIRVDKTSGRFQKE